MIALAGHDAGDALISGAQAAFGSSDALISATLKRATPLMWLGLAVAVAFRAGVLNIGAEGQFLVGAVCASAAGLYLPELPGVGGPLIVLAAGALGGMAWAGSAGWLLRRHGVNEVVSTLLLNLLASQLVGYLVRGPLQEPSRTYPQSSAVPEYFRVPLLLDGYRLHAGFLLAILAAGIIALLTYRHAIGFRWRVVGLGPLAAESAGLIDVGATRVRVLLLSGAFAGIAGAGELAGVTYSLFEGLSPGYGYTAIAVALIARLHPIGLLASAIAFGALGAAGDGMQRNSGVPADLTVVVSAGAILAVLAYPYVRARWAVMNPATDPPATDRAANA
ncbi:MAG: ABC transporter permease [Actinobacteria bacterium]|nr:ABC transporter permease [Actinomycetota bacterium]